MWKDITSYQRNEERIPRCFELNFGSFRIVLVKGHICHPGWWVVTCEPFMKQKELVEDGIHYGAAQEVAFMTIWASFCASMDALEIAKKELKL